MRIILFLSLVSLFACKNQSNESKIMKAKEGGEPSKDFMAFYDKFHADSSFQMAHIAWPLKGNADKKDENNMVVGKILREWEPENWILHKTMQFEGSTEFAREFDVYGDEMIVERIRTLALNYVQERHFSKREDGEWELIYYSEMQEKQ